jgi:hypothetical protein
MVSGILARNYLRMLSGRAREGKKIRVLMDELRQSLACNVCQDSAVQAIVLLCGHIYWADFLKVQKIRAAVDVLTEMHTYFLNRRFH